jgi:hypothetical protein
MITTPLKAQIKTQYEDIFAKRVRKEKLKAIEKWEVRKDYDAMLRVVDNEPDRFDLGMDTQTVILPEDISSVLDETVCDQENIAFNIKDYVRSTSNILKKFDLLYNDHI